VTHDARYCAHEMVLSIFSPFSINPWGNAMKSRSIALVTGTVICILSTPAMTQSPKDWADIKDPQELRALYSNKTFRGNGWVGHYRADGKGIVIVQGGKAVPRTWEVKGKDQVCATPEGGATSCFRFQRNRKDRNQVVLTNVKDGTSLNFTVEDGIPKF